MIKYYKGQHIIHLTDAVIEQQRKQSAKQRILVDPSKLKWKPYVLSPIFPGQCWWLLIYPDPSLVEHNWLLVSSILWTLHSPT
jgi:hypothetical protein